MSSIPRGWLSHQLLMSRLPPTDDNNIDAPVIFFYDLLVRSNHGSFMTVVSVKF